MAHRRQDWGLGELTGQLPICHRFLEQPTASFLPSRQTQVAAREKPLLH